MRFIGARWDGNALRAGDTGGNASAWGGDAGHGGTVRFDNCKVATVGTFDAWKGGGGGPAEAVGGNGRTAWWRGSSGGDGTARGGDGGPDGPIPQIPLVSGATQAGGLVNPPPLGFMGLAYGKGGDATATGGTGGIGGRRGGGPSGKEDALGGTGSGGTPATAATAAPVAGTAGPGGAGGVGVRSPSVGTL